MDWIVKNDGAGGYLVTDERGRSLAIPNNSANGYYQKVQDWIAEGNTPLPAEPPESPPTNDEKIDAMQEVFIAFLRAYAQREGLTFAQVRDAIKAQM